MPSRSVGRSFIELPFVPLGAYWSNTALRRELAGRVPGFPIFWGVRRA
jgi:peptide/nickel transport system substrate-binding protein